MNTKNVVIATIIGVALSSTSFPIKAGSNEVAKVPTVSADVPLTVELPFLYSQKLLTNNVQKEGMAFAEATNIPNATPIAYQEDRQEDANEGTAVSFKKYDVPLSDDLQKYTQELCDKYDVSYELILAIIEKESKYNSSLISETNDYGIMQINQSNFNQVRKYMKEEFGVNNFNWKDPYQNIAAGIYWFKITREEMLAFGFSEERIFPISILAYNMGAPKARTYLKSHSANDWKYVKEVRALKDKLERGESIHEKPTGVRS